MPALPLRASSVAGRALLVLCGAILVWALFFGGGDSSNRLLWIGGVALILAAVLVAATLDRRIARPRVSASAWACVACLTALVVWQGISITWSVEPDRSWDYVNRGLVYLAFLAVGMFVGALVPRAARATAGGLALLLGLVLAYALLAKGIPSLYPDYGRLARLRSPVGFWNGLALLGDFALVLGLWRAAQRHVDGVLLVFGAVVTVVLSYSRGGVVIGLIAAAAWLALDKRRFESLLALLVGGGAGLVVVGISLLLHGITDDGQPHSVRAHDGRLFLLMVTVAVAVVAAVGRVALRLEPSPETRRRGTALLLSAAGIACAAAIVVAALQGSGSTTLSAAGATHCTQGARRFGCGSSDARLDWWRQSLHLFADQPLQGSGAGSFDLAHRINRSEFTQPVTEPHNYALQTLGETGIVGFVLFVGAVASAAVAVRRRLGDDAAVALAICALAYLVHILVDIGYDFVAVSAPFFVLLGVLLVDSKAPAPPRREPVWALGVLVFAVAALLSLAAPYVAQRKVDQAVANEDPALAAQAHSWNPVSVDPLLTEAALEQGRRNDLKAQQLYRQAVSTQPKNPEPWVELGQFELDVMKNACTAYHALNEAYTLDHFNTVVATKGGPLDVARAKVNAGACE